MLRIATEELPDRQRDIGDIGLVREDFQGARGDPRGIHEQPQDLVHPIGVVHDAAQHQRALVLVQLLPALLERVPEPLHRRQR